MENAKTSLIPDPISEKPQDDDDQPLTPGGARTFKTCVGKAKNLSHHRPDIQHSVNTLSRSMRNPTMIAMRRLKKLTRSLLGTGDVYQEFHSHPQRFCNCRSTATGLTTKKLVNVAVEEKVSFTDAKCQHGNERKRHELFRAQKPSCTPSAQEPSKALEQHQLLQAWQYKAIPLLQTDSQRALGRVQTKRARQN